MRLRRRSRSPPRQSSVAKNPNLWPACRTRKSTSVRNRLRRPIRRTLHRPSPRTSSPRTPLPMHLSRPRYRRFRQPGRKKRPRRWRVPSRLPRTLEKTPRTPRCPTLPRRSPQRPIARRCTLVSPIRPRGSVWIPKAIYTRRCSTPDKSCNSTRREGIPTSLGSRPSTGAAKGTCWAWLRIPKTTCTWRTKPAPNTTGSATRGTRRVGTPRT